MSAETEQRSAGTQGPIPDAGCHAKMLNIPPKNVHLLYREGSGSYGRLECDDTAEDAALMSRAVGKPVRVAVDREDEQAWEIPMVRPSTPQSAAGIDARAT